MIHPVDPNNWSGFPAITHKGYKYLLVQDYQWKHGTRVYLSEYERVFTHSLGLIRTPAAPLNLSNIFRLASFINLAKDF